MDLPGYGRLEALSEGGSAEVFAARELVVKVLWDRGDRRFEREVEALRRVGAPVAPALIETGRLDDGRPFLVLERIEGRPIDEAAAELDHGGVLALLRGAAESVDRLASKGVVHRDLKPAHLILRDGRVTVLDFGIARFENDAGDPVAAEITGEQARIGTARYMSPEMCRGRPASAAADRYAFAVIAFELLAGAPPFAGSAGELRAAHLSRRVPRISDLAPLPPALDEIFARALAKRPGDRFASAAAVIDAIVAANAAPAPAPAPRRAKVTELPEQREVAVVALSGLASLDGLEIPGAQIAAVGHGRAIIAFASASTLAGGVRRAVAVGADRSGEDVGALVAVVDARVRERRGRLAVSGAPIRELLEAPIAEGDLLLEPRAAATLGAGATRPSGAGRFELAAPPRADMSEPTLRGRDAVIGEVDEIVEGGCSLTAIIGEPGLGKSRLAEVLAERCQPAWLLSAPPPDRPPEQLIRELLDRSGPSAVPAPALLQVAGLETPPPGPRLAAGALRGRAAESLARLIAGAGEDGLTVVIDDAHRAHSMVLDALELVTMDAGAPVRVIAIADRALDAVRSSFGSRAARWRRIELAPLGAEDAAELARELWAPARVADVVIERLVTEAAGVPLVLVELARAARASGALRQRSERSAFLAADELSGTAAPLAARIARARLAALPPSLEELAVVCAALGGPLTPQAIAAVWRPESAAIDPTFGLDQLVDAGLLTRGEGGLWFRHHLIRDGIAVVRGEATRVASAAALAVFPRATGDDDLARTVRLATATRDRSLAARAAAELAERHRARHAYLEAETYLTAALEQLEDDDPARAVVLTRRAEMRMRSFRFADALVDIREAVELARRAGDDEALVDRLLTEATILDWSFDFESSAARLEEAASLCDGTGLDDRFAAALALGRGRTAHRRDQLETALAQLGRASELAHAVGDRETWVAALMLRAPLCVYADDLETAEAHYADLIDDCEARGDQFHLGAVYNNRQILWMRRGDLAAATADLQRALRLARRLGTVQIEWSVSHNLAELLCWSGRLDAAAELAARAHDLQTRFVTEVEVPEDAVLRARIAVAAGQTDEAVALLKHARECCPESSWSAPTRIGARLVELSCSDSSASQWEAVWEDGSELHADHRLEIAWLAARAARARNDIADLKHWRDRVHTQLGRSESWAARFETV